MPKKLFLIVILTIFFLQSPVTASEPIKVIASFTILADMLHEIGGDKIVVKTLVGPDRDTHLYRPVPKDARNIMKADLIVINGLGLEPWFARLQAATSAKCLVIIASDGITPLMNHIAIADPHAWQNLANAKFYINNITNGLIKIDPGNQHFFEENARRYEEKLSALDQWGHKEFNKIPAEKRRVITSHDAFGYFGHSYGIEFIAPVGISTDAETTPKKIASLVELVKNTGIRAIFFENMADQRLVKQIARDGMVVMGGKLYADALSDINGPAASYEAMFRYNVNALVTTIEKN